MNDELITYIISIYTLTVPGAEHAEPGALLTHVVDTIAEGDPRLQCWLGGCMVTFLELGALGAEK